MNRLIDAFEGLFTAAAISGGELAETANFTLENVDWMGKPSKPEPVSNPIVDTHLEAACANSGQYGSSSHRVAEALLVVADQLRWRTPSTDREGEPDMAVLSRNFTSVSVIGEKGLLPSDKVTAGFSLQGPDTYYPPHAHRAEESYSIIGGDLAALASMKTRLKPGGLLLLSIRDYDALIADKPRFTSEHVQDRPDGRRIVFQLRDWTSDGRRYRAHQFLIKEIDGGYELKHFETEHRALLRDEVMAAVRGAGYQDVRWDDPEASGYYQPIVTARNR